MRRALRLFLQGFMALCLIKHRKNYTFLHCPHSLYWSDFILSFLLTFILPVFFPFSVHSLIHCFFSFLFFQESEAFLCQKWTSQFADRYRRPNVRTFMHPLSGRITQIDIRCKDVWIWNALNISRNLISFSEITEMESTFELSCDVPCSVCTTLN
jgi:hypothetical protein